MEAWSAEVVFDEPRGTLPSVRVPCAGWRFLVAAHGRAFGPGALLRVTAHLPHSAAEVVAYGYAMPAEALEFASRVCAFPMSAGGAATHFPFGVPLAARIEFCFPRAARLPEAGRVVLGGGSLRPGVLRGAVLRNDFILTSTCAVEVTTGCDELVTVGKLTAVVQAPASGLPFWDGDPVYRELRQMLGVARRAASLGVCVPTAVLLAGPGSCGKTRTAVEACRRMGVDLRVLSRNDFTDLGTAPKEGIAAVLIEDVESCNAGALMAALDSKPQGTVVIATTSAPQTVSPALRRPGRLDRELVFAPLSEGQRTRLFAALLNVSECDSLSRLAAVTVGYVSGDAAALAVRAKAQRHAEAIDTLQWAIANAPPASARRLDAAAVSAQSDWPTWDDLGGVAHVRSAVERAVEWPLRRADAMRRLGIRAARGVLMHGPPGCSKTTIARIVAGTAGASFFALAGGAAALYGAYVGEAEATLRRIFAAARRSAPAVVFLDEIDALVGRRTTAGTADEVALRVLATLLTEMDGIDSQAAPGAPGVLVLAATNRIDAVDEALLRPGRFDCVVHVGLPDADGRADIARRVLRRIPAEVAAAVAFEDCARVCGGLSGADIASVAREAAMAAIGRGAVELSVADVSCAFSALQGTLCE